MAGEGRSQSKPCRTPVEYLEKLLEGKRPAARAATSISPACLAFAWRPRSAARQNAASAYRPLCWRWVPQPNAKVAGLRGVLSSVACAGSLERPPLRNPTPLVRYQGAVSAAGRQPGAGERFFRALRPGLRRECPSPASGRRRHAMIGRTLFMNLCGLVVKRRVA